MIETDCQIKLAEGSTIVAMISRAPRRGRQLHASSHEQRQPCRKDQILESHHVNDCSLRGTTNLVLAQQHPGSSVNSFGKTFNATSRSSLVSRARYTFYEAGRCQAPAEFLSLGVPPQR